MTISPVAHRQLLPAARATARAGATRVGIGVVAAVGALIVRAALNVALGSETPFITLFPAVAIAAWGGGLLAGLVASVVGALLTITFVTPTTQHAAADVVRLGLYAAGAIVISALGGHMHEARERAEAARARADFLADASAVLTESLDTLTTVESLAQVAVPAYADWCAIDLLDASGRFTSSRIAHRDPQKVALGYRLRREHPLRIDAASGPGAVARTGDAEFMADVPPDVTRNLDPATTELLQGLDIVSYICAPLSVRGRVLGTLTVLMSESGRHFGADDLAVARDLGARAGVALDHARLYRRSAARGVELDRIISAMDDGVVIADADGTIRSHNPAAARILGERPTTLEAVESALLPASERAGAPDVEKVERTGRFVRTAHFDVEAAGETSRILVLRDMTEVLESRVAHDTFVGMLSHELRTPITTIYGTAQVLLRPVDDALRADLMRDLAGETDRLYRLVEDLLVLSRYERGSLDLVPEPVLLQRLLPRVTKAEQVRWPGLTVDVEVEPDLPPVVADATYVEQVVRNLVGNGAKYGGSQGHIVVRGFNDADGFVTVEVRDTGPGVPEDQVDRIFELYERLPTAQQAGIPGAGIGLFVCKRLVDLMGGRIGVRGAGYGGEQGGAAFWFSLPRDVEAMPPEGSAAPGLSESAGPESPTEAAAAAEAVPESPTEAAAAAEAVAEAAAAKAAAAAEAEAEAAATEAEAEEPVRHSAGASTGA
ncbi:MAG TPA: ATP-binding protein [Candidatus Limnocylindrales bacterium]